jgi:hypothetical protein
MDASETIKGSVKLPEEKQVLRATDNSKHKKSLVEG